MSAVASHGNALAHGTMLLWYAVETVLGQGAFGITYLAEDTNLHRWIAIKEFLPGPLARRKEDGTVEALNDELAADFSVGRQRFIDEARILARFEHPNIVRVHNVFEANGTAYMVMQYEEGEGLDQLLKRRGTLREDEVLRIVHPLLDGLESIHALGFLHRDIKPANIFIRHDGTPALLDFGSARQANTGEARNLTSFVSPGYAPIEQYAGKSDSQGPWTDIYGLGATIYRVMTGKPPTDAVERSLGLAHQAQDSYEPPATQEPYSAQLVEAVDCALRFRAADRPQSIATWRTLLPPAPPGAGDDTAATSRVTPAARPATVGYFFGKRRDHLLGAVAVVVFVTVMIWIARDSDETPLSEAPPAAREIATVTTAGTQPPPSPPATAAVLAPTPVPAGPTVQPQVEQLLYGASLDLEALRLMSPSGNNAYEKYREVLDLAPANGDALRGIEAIVDRYVSLAYVDIEKNRLARAASYLGKAATLLPERASVIEARRALEAARTTATTATAAGPVGGRGEKLQQDFDSFVREQKSTQRPAENTRATDLLKRLGGGN